MAEKSNEVAAALDGMSGEMAAELRRHFNGLKSAPVANDAASVASAGEVTFVAL